MKKIFCKEKSCFDCDYNNQKGNKNIICERGHLEIIDGNMKIYNMNCPYIIWSE